MGITFFQVKIEYFVIKLIESMNEENVQVILRKTRKNGKINEPQFLNKP